VVVIKQAERQWNQRVTASSPGLPTVWDLQNAIRRSMNQWYHRVYNDSRRLLCEATILEEGEYYVDVNPDIEAITVYVTHGERRHDFAAVLAMIDQRFFFGSAFNVSFSFFPA
jgi:hypothetical protein